MKKRLSVLVLAVVLLFGGFTGCGTTTPSTPTITAQQWSTLTPDQQSRILVDQFQTQLGNYFDQGKAYVGTDPAKLVIWKTKVIPAFDVANKALAGFDLLVGQGKATPDAIQAKLPGLVQAVLSELTALGVTIK